jgi:hypothetical protein
MQLFAGDLKDIGPTIGVLCFSALVSLLGMFTPLFTAEANAYHIASIAIFAFVASVCISTLGYSIHLVPTESEILQEIELVPMPPVERPVTSFCRPCVPGAMNMDLGPLIDERERLAKAEQVEVQRLAREMADSSDRFQQRERARRRAMEGETGIARRVTRYWRGAGGAEEHRATAFHF